jgi:SnoaL-like domain
MDEADLVRITELEARLARLEDDRAVRDVIANYCYRADGCRDEELLAMFADDGLMASVTGGETTRTEGREAIWGAITNPSGNRHPDLYGKSMHLLGNNVVVEIDGDGARATSYSFSFKREDDRIVILAASSNRWTLRRSGSDWLIVERRRAPMSDESFGRIIDGTA